MLYAKLDDVALAKRPDTRAMRAALEKGDLEAIGAGLCNVFEQVAIPDHLELNYIKSIMMSYGAYGAQMTGSGSAVYGLFDSFEYAAVACTMLKDKYSRLRRRPYRILRRIFGEPKGVCRAWSCKLGSDRKGGWKCSGHAGADGHEHWKGAAT